MPEQKKDEFTVSKLFFTKHENKNMIEVKINNILIAKNVDDDLMNITQIFNLRGLSEEEMTNILRGDEDFINERTEIDDGKYKGIWIKSDHAVNLAKKMSILEPLRSLVEEKDIPIKSTVDAKESTNDIANSTTTADVIMSTGSNEEEEDKDVEISNSDSKVSSDNNNNVDIVEIQDKQNNNTTNNDSNRKSILSRSFSVMTEVDEKNEPSSLSTKDNIDSSKPDLQSPTKKLKKSTTNKNLIESATLPMDISSIENYEQIKEMVSQIFLTEGVLNLETSNQLVQHKQIDLPIDTHGNSLLHWSASLANLNLTFQLVELGGNVKCGNNLGETALMKAVAHVNFFETMMFEKLVDILYPSIPVLDKKKRSILHHIVLFAGSEGKSAAALYYMDAIVEWIIKNGPNKKNAISLNELMSEIVNLQDTNGDTALNIIARIGNKAIAQLLLNIGADPKILNNAGLSPIDFRLTGITMQENKLNGKPLILPLSGNGNDKSVNGNVSNEGTTLVNAEKSSLNTSTNLGKKTDSTNEIINAAKASEEMAFEFSKKLSQERNKVLESMLTMMGGLSNFFETELNKKQKDITKLYADLQVSNTKLAKLRDQLEVLKFAETRLNELNQKILNVEKSIQDEETKFASQYPETLSSKPDSSSSPSSSTTAAATTNFNGDRTKPESVDKPTSSGQDITTYDPDQPFKVPAVYEAIEAAIAGKTDSLYDAIDSIDINTLDGVSKEEIEQLSKEIPAYVLKARIQAYKDNEEYLTNLSNTLNERSMTLENKFRHVVLLCTGVDESKVDGLLEGLVQAVETDLDETDITKVGFFLNT